MTEIMQIYQHFKKYQIEHEKKHPPKGEALAKKWEEFKENQKKLAEMKKEQANAPAGEKEAKEPKQEVVKE